MMKQHALIRNRLFFLLWMFTCGIFSPVLLNAQHSILENYIRTGLENNLGLKQAEDSLKLRILELDEAKGLFLPDINLNARYTVAQGGRVIEFPVGDLLNPVYQNLNYLNQQLSIPSGAFPENLENEEFYFYRPVEQETKIQLVQPIIAPQLVFNRQLRTLLADAERFNTMVFKRFLVAEIKKAYFNYLKSLEVNQLIDNTKILLEENLRVNKKLYENQKVTVDHIFRAEAELGKLDQQKIQAQQQQYLAASYFNFLLNRPFGEEIQVDSAIVIENFDFDLTQTQNMALANREEFQQMESYSGAASSITRMSRSAKFPSLYGAVEYGFQGEKYSFTEKDDYMLASLVLKWPLFQGFRNNTKIQEARVKEEILNLKTKETRSRILLQTADKWFGVKAAEATINAGSKQLLNAKKAFEIVERKYREGQVSLFEFIDARNAVTSAEINYINSKYDYLIQYAELEQSVGLFRF
ncbi:MAG: TolC family protein [Bacteroidales bacterium]|nr:TolC family protein [Bacteroidales bacterium]